jgi:hypothetical protein
MIIIEILLLDQLERAFIIMHLPKVSFCAGILWKAFIMSLRRVQSQCSLVCLHSQSQIYLAQLPCTKLCQCWRPWKVFGGGCGSQRKQIITVVGFWMKNCVPLEGRISFGQGLVIQSLKKVPSLMDYKVWGWGVVSNMKFWIFYQSPQTLTQRGQGGCNRHHQTVPNRAMIHLMLIGQIVCNMSEKVVVTSSCRKEKCQGTCQGWWSRGLWLMFSALHEGNNCISRTTYSMILGCCRKSCRFCRSCLVYSLPLPSGWTWMHFYSLPWEYLVVMVLLQPGGGLLYLQSSWWETWSKSAFCKDQ